jgi:anti-sigma factor ChrR (cupin superfamily)
MMTDDLEALVMADAIGALDDNERTDLAARLAAVSAEERAAATRLYDSTLMIAASVDLQEPPAHVRDRVLAAVREPAQYTVTATDAWGESGVAGITAKILAVDKPRQLVTMLLKGVAGAVYPSHRHTGPEECYVIRGSISVGDLVLRTGDFHHADSDSDHDEILVLEDAEVLLVAAIADYLPN